MKLVREHINEFERGDDALKNLGIGIDGMFMDIPRFHKEIMEYLRNYTISLNKFEVGELIYEKSDNVYYFNIEKNINKMQLTYWPDLGQINVLTHKCIPINNFAQFKKFLKHYWM
jgi:hypothetical protein